MAVKLACLMLVVATVGYGFTQQATRPVESPQPPAEVALQESPAYTPRPTPVPLAARSTDALFQRAEEIKKARAELDREEAAIRAELTKRLRSLQERLQQLGGTDHDHPASLIPPTTPASDSIPPSTGPTPPPLVPPSTGPRSTPVVPPPALPPDGN